MIHVTCKYIVLLLLKMPHSCDNDITVWESNLIWKVNHCVTFNFSSYKTIDIACPPMKCTYLYSCIPAIKLQAHIFSVFYLSILWYDLTDMSGVLESNVLMNRLAINWYVVSTPHIAHQAQRVVSFWYNLTIGDIC